MAVETRERAERRVPKIANQMIALVLRSSLHRLVSKGLLLLTFTGMACTKRRKSCTYDLIVFRGTDR